MSNRINLDDPNYDHSQRVVVQDNKAKILWVVIGIIAAILIVVYIMQSGVGSSSSGSSGSTALDPNRTWESCTRYGETRVFGSTHDTTLCYPDYDGYYHVSLGHHHHK